MTGFLQSGLYKLVVSWRLSENNRKGNQLFFNTQEKKAFYLQHTLKMCVISMKPEKNE